jgi:hypothetical protein
MKITETRLRALIRETLSEAGLDPYEVVAEPGVARAESGGYVLPNGNYLAPDPELSLLAAQMQMIQDLQKLGIKQVIDDEGDGARHSLAAWKKKVRLAQAGR